jgi:hypothetical protein
MAGLVAVRSWRAAFTLAVLEAEAIAVHLQDVDVAGEVVEQVPGEALGAEDLAPLLEGPC